MLTTVIFMYVKCAHTVLEYVKRHQEAVSLVNWAQRGRFDRRSDLWLAAVGGVCISVHRTRSRLYTFHFFLHTFTPVYSSVAFLHARSDRPESVFLLGFFIWKANCCFFPRLPPIYLQSEYTLTCMLTTAALLSVWWLHTQLISLSLLVSKWQQ